MVSPTQATAGLSFSSRPAKSTPLSVKNFHPFLSLYIDGLQLTAVTLPRCNMCVNVASVAMIHFVEVWSRALPRQSENSDRNWRLLVGAQSKSYGSAGTRPSLASAAQRSTLSRRAFLGRTAGAAVALGAGSSLLAACGGAGGAGGDKGEV